MDFLEFLSTEFAACSKPPSRDKHRKAFYPWSQQVLNRVGPRGPDAKHKSLKQSNSHKEWENLSGTSLILDFFCFVSANALCIADYTCCMKLLLKLVMRPSHFKPVQVLS